MTTFAVVGLYDELWSGVAVVAAPEVEELHRVDHTQYSLWIFAVPMLCSALLEAPIALASDRIPRRFVLAAGLAGLAASLGLCALATTPWLLGGALALAGAASGVACGAAQAELVTSFPGGAQPAMSRWVAYSAVGDALTPMFVAAAMWAGGTHRSALAAIAVLLAVQALLTLWIAPRGSVIEADEEERVLPLRAALGSAAREPRLWLFLFGASACTLLDELVVALAALRLHGDLGWSEAFVAAAMTGFSAGGIVGAVANERLLAHVSPRRLLTFAALASIASLTGFICASSAVWAAFALFLLGITATAHYPLVKAAAFEFAPGQPGVVNALAQIFVGVEVLVPLAVGAIASAYGLSAALAALALEPLVLLLVAACWRR